MDLTSAKDQRNGAQPSLHNSFPLNLTLAILLTAAALGTAWSLRHDLPYPPAGALLLAAMLCALTLLSRRTPRLQFVRPFLLAAGIAMLLTAAGQTVWKVSLPFATGHGFLFRPGAVLAAALCLASLWGLGAHTRNGPFFAFYSVLVLMLIWVLTLVAYTLIRPYHSLDEHLLRGVLRNILLLCAAILAAPPLCVSESRQSPATWVLILGLLISGGVALA